MPAHELVGHTVQFCEVCRCKTWHVEGICEWSDGHELTLAKRAAMDRKQAINDEQVVLLERAIEEQERRT